MYFPVAYNGHKFTNMNTAAISEGDNEWKVFFLSLQNKQT